MVEGAMDIDKAKYAVWTWEIENLDIWVQAINWVGQLASLLCSSVL